MTTLYNGSVYVEGLFSTGGDGTVGVSSSDTILSLLNYIGYYTSNRVMMEIGGYNTTVGNWTTVYKYAMGYSNIPAGTGGSYIIQACKIGSNSYSPGAVPSPITITTLNLSGLTIDYGSLYVGNNQDSAYYSVSGTYNYAPMHKYIYAGLPVLNVDGGKFAIAHNLVLQGQGLTWGGGINIPGANIVIEGAKSSYASQSTDNAIYFNTSMGQKAVMDSYGVSVTGGNFRVAVGYAATNGIEISNSNITGYYAGGNGILFGSNQYYTMFHCTGNSGGHMIADYGFLWDVWNLTYNAYTHNRAWANKNYACASSRIEMGQSRIQFYTGTSGAIPSWTTMMTINNSGVYTTGTFSVAPAGATVAFIDAGGIHLRNVVEFAANVWNTSTDGVNRIYFENNSRTYFGSLNGYNFRNSVGTDILTIANNGTTQVNGVFTVAPAGGTVAFIDAGGMHLRSALEFSANLWNTSTDGINRLYYGYNSTTYFGSASGYNFRNSVATDIFTIGNNGDTYITGNVYAAIGLNCGGALNCGGTLGVGAQVTMNAGLNVTGQTNLYGNVYSSGILGVGAKVTMNGGLNVTGQTNLYGNVYSSGIFSGNGSGLTNLPTPSLFSSNPNSAYIWYFSPATSQNTTNSIWGGFSGSNPRIYVNISQPIGTYTTTKYLLAYGDIYTGMTFKGGGRTNRFTRAGGSNLPYYALYVDLTNSSGTRSYIVFFQSFSTDLNGDFGADTVGNAASVGGQFYGTNLLFGTFPGILSVQDTKKNNSITSQMFKMVLFGAYTVKFRIEINMEMQSGDNGANYTAAMTLPTNGPINITYE